jgi:hypothetical protein
MCRTRRTCIAVAGFVLALQGHVVGQRPGVPSDTVALEPTMLDPSRIQTDTAIFRAFVLPCEYGPHQRLRQFGELKEVVLRKGHGDSTLLLKVTWEPLLAGGYVIDSSAYDGHSLMPIWTRVHSALTSVDIAFYRDSVTWRVRPRTRQSGSARIPHGSYAAAGDRLLVRALRNPRALTGKLMRVPFVNPPGFEGEAAFEGYLFVAPADSFHSPGIRTSGAWAVQLGSGQDNTFFVDRRTHELLGWEVAEWEGTCPLRYVRSR